MGRKAIIIGAGIGGIASAIRLAHLGFETTVFEMNSEPGGKIRSSQFKGYRFDMGPSVFTEPQLVDELLLLKATSSSNFSYHKLPVSCNYFFEDGLRVALPSGSKKVSEVLHKELGEDQGKVLKYLRKLQGNYDSVYPVFISASLHKISHWLNRGLFRALFRIPKYGLITTMNDMNQKQFNNNKTVQIFNRFATYNGSNPYEAPGMLNIIAHLELNIGPYMPKGGIISIIESLYSHAKALGVEFLFNKAVTSINHEGHCVSGVSIDGKAIEADLVVSNMDVHNTYKKLLSNLKGPEKILKQEKSTSAVVFYWGVKKKFSQLDVHNIFFSDDYEEEFRTMFKDKSICSDPTVYIHISSKIESGDAPEHCENWFVMVNAPINTGQDWDELRAKLRKNILLKLNRILEEDLEQLIEVEEYMDPVKMEDMYAGMQGSIYGNSSNSKMSAFYRHPNFSSQIKGLYFAGVTVHPGGGIPLALNSAKIIEKCVKKDFNLI